MANALWPAARFVLEPSFLQRAGELRAEASTVDFGGDAVGACRRINHWAEENTNKKITNLLSPECAAFAYRMIA